MASEQLDMMYNFVQSNLKNVATTLDLLPFINALMTFKNLKVQLSMALHRFYSESKADETANDKHGTKYNAIQSLFFQLQRLGNVKNESLKSSKSSVSLFNDAIVDKHCLSSTSCIALHRITKALLYYDNILNKASVRNTQSVNKLLLTYFNETNYKHLLNDYHHICCYHINKKNINESNDEFELIYNQIIKYVHPCDVTKCMKFRRNRRIREDENIKILNCDNDINTNFYVDTLDSIHCYFLHSFDIGMRINQNQLFVDNDSNNKKTKKIKVDDDQFYTDTKLEKLKKIINEKLLPLRKQYVIKGGQNKYFSNMNDEAETSLLRTLAPLCKNVFNSDKQGKFETIVSEILPDLKSRLLDIIKWLIKYIHDEEFIDEEAIRLDLEDEQYSHIRNSLQTHFELSDDVSILICHILQKDIFNGNNDKRARERERETSKSTFSTSTSYDFGHKFYYWDEFKENNQHDYGPNIGYKKKDWYIERKYVNIKQELINNKIFKLPIEKYNNLVKKCEMNLNTVMCRNNKSSDSLSCEYYKIRTGTGLTVENLISLILYTDFIGLAFEFRRTFRPISDEETNEQLKNRHREYWNWSKILSETVELYGESMSDQNIGIFYYGVSFLLSFPNFISHFCGPTSTTSYFEVSCIFSDDNGIILELIAENEYSNLKVFNCSYLSYYGHENEHLFFGGYRPLKFKSILLLNMHMEPPQNYSLFIKALTLFNYVVKAKRLSFDIIANITKIDYKIIKSLMRHYMTRLTKYKNKSPNYVNNLFKSFCDSKKYIHINIAWINKFYPGFKKYLLCNDIDIDDNKNMLSLEIIAALFPHCNEVIVFHDVKTGKLNKCYLNKLIQQLKILNIQHRNMLKVIKLCNVRYENKLLSREFEKEFAIKFEKEAFCRINVDIKVRLQHENKHNNKLFKEIPEYSHLVITRQYIKYKASLKTRDLKLTTKNNYRHKAKRKKHKQRSRSYHRKKLTAI